MTPVLPHIEVLISTRLICYAVHISNPLLKDCEMGILSLSDITSSTTELVGGKASNLAKLIQAGFPVPPGFVVTTAGYQDIFQQLGLNDGVHQISEANPEEQQELARRIRIKLESAPCPDHLAQEIYAAHNRLQAQQADPLIYAVRSSATAEDLSDASFAGQHDTYYYVNESSLVEMIKKCWGSLWSETSISYRTSQGIAHSSVRMAVIAQVMVKSDCSGVTFTANPVTGNREQIINESTWGMGAAIVDGRVNPDRFIVERSSLEIIERHIANKTFMVPAEPATLKGSRLLEVPLRKRQKHSLTDEQVLLITDWALKSESYFGQPQDLEWAFQDNQFYLLQSRPITVLGKPAPEEMPAGQFVLFKAIAENFTSPIYPLTADLIVKPLPMMEMINGRAYLKLSVLKPLFPIRITDKQIAELAYLSSSEAINFQVSWRKVPAFLLILTLNYLISAVLARRIDNMPDDFMEGFRKVIDRIDLSPEISADQVVESVIATGFFAPVGNMVILVNIISASRYPIFLALLAKLLRRWLPDLRPDAEALLCSGSDGILSTDMGRAIWQLAAIARDNEELSNVIRNESADHVLEKLHDMVSATDFLAALENFKAVHGHRALKEFELQSRRWEEDLSTVIGMVRNYLLVDANPDDIEAKSRESRIETENYIREALQTRWLEKQTGWRWFLLNRIRKQAKYLTKLRENSRFYHIMAFYAVRKKIINDEIRLLAAGILKCKDDIFYLLWDELSKLKSGEWSWLDVEEIIRKRRMEYIRRNKISPARTVGIESGDEQIAELSIHTLSGQGASPGVYVGTARVILDPAVNTEILPGEILVAPYTDPAWTPLFLIAHAAVVEVGSYLSHAGTIAREYGMPCVVDVENCTSRIKTGDRIRVNGTLGLVEFTQVEALP